MRSVGLRCQIPRKATQLDVAPHSNRARRDADQPTFALYAPATTTFAPLSAMPLMASSIIRSSPLLYAFNSSAFLMTTVPFVSVPDASMEQPKTATLACSGNRERRRGSEMKLAPRRGAGENAPVHYPYCLLNRGLAQLHCAYTRTFSTCLTEPSESRCTTTPLMIWESDTVPPISFATRTLSTEIDAFLVAGGMTVIQACDYRQVQMGCTAALAIGQFHAARNDERAVRTHQAGTAHSTRVGWTTTLTSDTNSANISSYPCCLLANTGISALVNAALSLGFSSVKQTSCSSRAIAFSLAFL